MGSIPPIVKVHTYSTGRNRSGMLRDMLPSLTPGHDNLRGDAEDDWPILLSIGIMAWNEEDSIPTTLKSLFQQSIFEKLAVRRRRCEIICIANGCTDRTVEVARAVFAQMEREHPHSEAFSTRVVDIEVPGRNNAWNRFIHEFSSPDTAFICLMDADIVFRRCDTIHSLVETLERDIHAQVSAGRHYKDVFFKKNKSWRDRLSIATSTMNGTIAGRFSGQLYCLRASVVRNIRLPRDLGATDDGFLKAIICTDFLTREVDATRIASAPDAEIIFEAYVSFRDVLNNQMRQMIGQTTVHVLLGYLRTLPAEARAHLADTVLEHERSDPDWLKKIIGRHIRETRFFWRLFPGLLTFRFRRLGKLPGLRKITHAPAATAGFLVTLIASWRAFRFLKSGMSQYWPKASRGALVTAPEMGSH